eukprot:TRINITY_DN5085_c2_g1_i1.p1 TRINITY_DN5085_c2_g1~~TRINITY_DN5085_c2_g1_i1.p1  ORF type:complete len:195 (+),score=29.51 TRINITY_DN5085_c2_g1_i1:61-645(+)
MRKILKTRGVLTDTVEAVINMKTVLGDASGLMVDAAGLAVEEAGIRCEIQAEEGSEIEVALWAWKALRENRMFCFHSRMRCLQLSLPSGNLTHGANAAARASVLDHRQRAMASVVLNALTDPSIHHRHQLEEVFKGAGSLQIPPLYDPIDMRTDFCSTTLTCSSVGEIKGVHRRFKRDIYRAASHQETGAGAKT